MAVYLIYKKQEIKKNRKVEKFSDLCNIFSAKRTLD